MQLRVDPNASSALQLTDRSSAMADLPRDGNNGELGGMRGHLGALCFLLRFSLNLKLLYKQSLLTKRRKKKKGVTDAQRDVQEP